MFFAKINEVSLSVKAFKTIDRNHLLVDNEYASLVSKDVKGSIVVGSNTDEVDRRVTSLIKSKIGVERLKDGMLQVSFCYGRETCNVHHKIDFTESAVIMNVYC